MTCCLDFDGEGREAQHAEAQGAASAAAAGVPGIAPAIPRVTTLSHQSLESAGAPPSAEAVGPSPEQIQHLKRKAEVISGDRLVCSACGAVWGL